MARAQSVGTIADLEGTAELGRNGAWSPLAIGATIDQADQLRTGQPGRLRIVFQDKSVLTMTDNSEVVIDEDTFNPESGVARTSLRLLQGKLRALASEYYANAASSFRVHTQTAVAGVRGTEFVMVFDPVAEVSEVVGVSGQVAVHSPLDPVGNGVTITAKELTSVARGQYPSTPRKLREVEFRQYLDKLEFIGSGKPESLVAGLPLVTGAGVPESERASAIPGAFARTTPDGTASDEGASAADDKPAGTSTDGSASEKGNQAAPGGGVWAPPRGGGVPRDSDSPRGFGPDVGPIIGGFVPAVEERGRVGIRF